MLSTKAFKLKRGGVSDLHKSLADMGPEYTKYEEGFTRAGFDSVARIAAIAQSSKVPRCWQTRISLQYQKPPQEVLL